MSSWRGGSRAPVLSPLGVEERQSPKALSCEAALPIALKTFPFPDRSSLLERLSPFLKPTVACGSFSHCSTGMVLLGWSFSSQRGFCIFTMPLPDERFLCEGRAYQHPACRRRWEREKSEKSFNLQVSLRHKQGLIFGKIHGGQGAQLLLTWPEVMHPNQKDDSLCGEYVSHSTQPNGRKLSRLSSRGRAMRKELCSTEVQPASLTLHARVAIENH